MEHLHGVVIPDQSSDPAPGTPRSHRRPAAPPAHPGAVPQRLHTAHKAGPALAAFDLAGEHIAVGVSAAAAAMLVVLLHPRLGQIPDLPGDDGRMVILNPDLRHLPAVSAFLMGQIVGGIGLFLHQVPHILLVMQNFENGRGLPLAAAAVRSIPRPGQEAGQGGGAHLLHGIFLKNQPDQLRALRLDGEAAVLYLVAQQGPAEDHALLHPAGLPPDHPAGGFAALVLGHGGHDGQAQLAVAVHGVDMVGDKFHRHANPLELPGIAERVHDIAGKPADLLGENQLKLPLKGVLHHPVELDALPGAGAGDSLVGIDGIQRPVWISFDVGPEILLLGRKGIGLIVLLGGHPAIGCNINHRDAPFRRCSGPGSSSPMYAGRRRV